MSLILTFPNKKTSSKVLPGTVAGINRKGVLASILTLCLPWPLLAAPLIPHQGRSKLPSHLLRIPETEQTPHWLRLSHVPSPEPITGNPGIAGSDWSGAYLELV